MTIKQALIKGAQKISAKVSQRRPASGMGGYASGVKNAQIPSASLDAEILLAFVLKKTKEFLHTHPEKKLTQSQLKKYNSLINRRAKLEPVAYLINHKEFFGLDFYVDKNVLIPRPETELLIEEALKIIKRSEIRDQRLIDVGTGSGCIAISLTKNLPNAKITAIDSSQKALNIAQKNARLNKVSKQIKFVKDNLLKIYNLKPNTYNLITANLPYLTPSQYAQNPELKYEPKQALTAGSDGLKYYRELFKQLKTYSLQATAYKLIIEIDPSQTSKIKKLIKQYHPQTKIKIKKDLAGLNRVVIIQT